MRSVIIMNTSPDGMSRPRHLLTNNGSIPVSSHQSCTWKDPSANLLAWAMASKSFISIPNLTAMAW